MGPGSRCVIFLTTAAMLALMFVGITSVTALSCEAPDPDEGPIVGTIQIVDLAPSGEVIEVPYWTRDGCASPVYSAPAALHDDWFVFFEDEGHAKGSGALKAIDLATDERRQAVIETKLPRLAIGDPYVYLLAGARDEPRQLTGYPLLTDEDHAKRVLQVPSDTQVHLGMHTYHRLDTPTDGPPRLTTVDLPRWEYIHNEKPLPVSTSHHWRLLGGSKDWSLLEQYHEPLERWKTVPDDARVWVYQHATEKMLEIQIPAENDDIDYSSEHNGPNVFTIDGDRLYYTIYKPWTETHLESLRLPHGSPSKVHDGQGLSGARVDNGRLILFMASKDTSIPDWQDVELQRYNTEFDWNELPSASGVYLVMVIFMIFLRGRTKPQGDLVSL